MAANFATEAAFVQANLDPTRAESDDDNDSEEESALDTGGHSAQVGDEPHHARPVHGGGKQQVH